MSHLWRALSSAARRHPMAANVTGYAVMCAAAEGTVQKLERILDRKEGKDKEEKEEDLSLDLGAVGRMTAIGGLVMAPALHAWYRLLDGRLPGRSRVTVAKKLALDCTVASLPLYSAFYIGGTDMQYYMAQNSSI